MHSIPMNSYFSLTGNIEVTVLSTRTFYFPSFNIVPDIFFRAFNAVFKPVILLHKYTAVSYDIQGISSESNYMLNVTNVKRC